MAGAADTIREYFDRFGWHYDFDATTGTWVTGFRGEASTFNILVHLSENWVYFIISPFVNAPRSAVCAHRIHEYLLRLNHTINLAKFSIDGEGDVVLTVELPIEDLSYDAFCDGLNAVSYYADEHYLDVLNLAQDPDYVPNELEEDELDEEWDTPAHTSDELNKPN